MVSEQNILPIYIAFENVLTSKHKRYSFERTSTQVMPISKLHILCCPDKWMNEHSESLAHDQCNELSSNDPMQEIINHKANKLVSFALGWYVHLCLYIKIALSLPNDQLKTPKYAIRERSLKRVAARTRCRRSSAKSGRERRTFNRTDFQCYSSQFQVFINGLA